MSSLNPGIPDIKALSLGGVLSVAGNQEDNTIEISRAENNILVNDGDVRVFGKAPTVENTKLIQAFGRGGDDVITLDETNGALPNANLFGGAGNDIITGGSGNDLIFGQSGNDHLFGKGGDDQLFGGSGDDVLTGGNGTDGMFGEAGDDRMIWNPGEGSDLMEGGSGYDVAEVNGGNGAENFTIAANGDRVSFDRVSPAPFNLDIGATELIELSAGGVDDVITAGNGIAALTSLKIDGGEGNDTINGGDGADLLYGGAGNDFIDGNRGNDTAFLGDGDDVFQWDPGDGSDSIEGGEGKDTLLFNGANVAENINITASGERAIFFRDVANITMDNNDVERFDFNALGGEDNIVVNDMTGTDVTEVNLDLAGTPGGTVGDAVVDTVLVKGTENRDAINVSAQDGAVLVAGLAASVVVEHADATDVVHIEGLGGDDVISAGIGLAPLATLKIDGGEGNDTINGGDGADLLYGGAGDDFIDGNRGNDTALLGDGDDVFQWDPGDGSDVVEGGEGNDTLLFNGANAAENINISANGERAIFFRDVANITMDNNDVERFDFNALGGVDNIVVNDMTGTDVTEVNLDLAGTLGGTEGDAVDDGVVVKGTDGDDVITLSLDNGSLIVDGLAARIVIEHFDFSDTLSIEGLGGDDVIDASAIAEGGMHLSFDGGDGDDILLGGGGDDSLFGGNGDDVLLGGLGTDVLDGGAGDNILIQ